VYLAMSGVKQQYRNALVRQSGVKVSYSEQKHTPDGSMPGHVKVSVLVAREAGGG
jgi:hypothetical protein